MNLKRKRNQAKKIFPSQSPIDSSSSSLGDDFETETVTNSSPQCVAAELEKNEAIPKKLPAKEHALNVSSRNPKSDEERD